MALLVSNALAGIVPWARVPAVLTATSPTLDRVAAMAAFASDFAFEIERLEIAIGGGFGQVRYSLLLDMFSGSVVVAWPCCHYYTAPSQLPKH